MHNQDKTHCKHGHEFTPSNTRTRVAPSKQWPGSLKNKTYRTCRECEQLRNKRSAAGYHAYERRRIVAWLRDNGHNSIADRIERCDHIIRRSKPGPFAPHPPLPEQQP